MKSHRFIIKFILTVRRLCPTLSTLSYQDLPSLPLRTVGISLHKYVYYK